MPNNYEYEPIGSLDDLGAVLELIEAAQTVRGVAAAASLAYGSDGRAPGNGLQGQIQEAVGARKDELRLPTDNSPVAMSW